MSENRKSAWGRIKSFDYLPLILAFAIIIAFFGITTNHFFALRNFMNILLYAANVGILSCTMTLILVSGNIDLSVGSVIALGGIVMGTCLNNGLPTAVAILICLLACMLTGLYNAIMITRVHVNAFITTLAGMQIFRGVAYIITNGKSITITNEAIKFIGRGYLGPIPNAVIIMLALVVLFTWIARSTVFGRRIYVIGGSSNVAFLSGIDVSKNLSLLFILNGLLCGVTTVVYCSQLGAAMPQNATGMEFDVITAVVLGGTSMSGGKGTIVGSIIGALLIGTLNNGMVMMNIQSYWQDVIGGIVLVIAVIFDIIKNRK